MDKQFTNLDYIKINNLGIFYIWENTFDDYSKLIQFSNIGLRLDLELELIIEFIKSNDYSTYTKIMEYLNQPLECGQCIFENKIRNKNLGYTVEINKATHFSKELQYTPGGGFVCKKHYR